MLEIDSRAGNGGIIAIQTEPGVNGMKVESIGGGWISRTLTLPISIIMLNTANYYLVMCSYLEYIIIQLYSIHYL